MAYDESPDVLIVYMRRSPVRPGMTSLHDKIAEDKFADRANLSDSSEVSVFEDLEQLERCLMMRLFL